MTERVKRITSRDNMTLKRIRQLSLRKYREKFEQFIIEGPVAIAEALEENADIRLAVCDDHFIKGMPEQEQIDRLLARGIAVYSVEQGLFSSLSDTEHPQGVLAVVEKKRWQEEIVKAPGGNLLVLDRIADPGNLGTMLRTAEAAGFQGVICLKGTVDPYSAKVARAAAGALLRMPVFFMDGPEQLIFFLKSAGKRLLCTSPRARITYYEADLSRNVALVIGNEASGVCGELLAQADATVIIPMEGRTESLNAGVAAAVLMFESMRQNHQKV